MDKNFSNAFPIKMYNNKKDYFAAQNLVLCDFSVSKDANQALIVWLGIFWKKNIADKSKNLDREFRLSPDK